MVFTGLPVFGKIATLYARPGVFKRNLLSQPEQQAQLPFV